MEEIGITKMKMKTNLKEVQMEKLVSALEKRRALVRDDAGDLTTEEAFAAWESVGKELSRVYKTPLTGAQAKGKWSDLKYRVKKKVGVSNRKLPKLGDGETTVLLTPFDARVLRLIGVIETDEDNIPPQVLPSPSTTQHTLVSIPPEKALPKLDETQQVSIPPEKVLLKLKLDETQQVSIPPVKKKPKPDGAQQVSVPRVKILPKPDEAQQVRKPLVKILPKPDGAQQVCFLPVQILPTSDGAQVQQALATNNQPLAKRKKVRFTPVQILRNLLDNGEDSQLVSKSEVPLSQIFTSQDSEGDYYEIHDTNNLIIPDQLETIGTYCPEDTNNVHGYATTDNEESNIESALHMKRHRLFKHKRKGPKSNIDRLLEIEERKLELKAEKVRQTSRIADYLETLVELKRQKLDLDSHAQQS